MTLFADDITIVFSDKDINKLNTKVNNAMIELFEYFRKNKLILNVKKSSFILFGTEKSDFVVKYNGESTEQRKEVKILGITLDNKMGFKTHLNQISSKDAKTVGTISRVRHFLPTNTLNILYNALIVPQMTYGCCLWGFTYAKQKDRLIKLQKRVAQIITFSDFRASSEQLFKLQNWIPFEKIIEFETCKFIYKSASHLI